MFYKKPRQCYIIFMSIKEKLLTTKYLSGSTLKIIACICMFIDHFFHLLRYFFGGYVSTLDYDSIKRFNTIYRIGRDIGRVAFPIFCFLLVEGFLHTRNLIRYFLRLLVMALASEHAFNLLYSGQHLDKEGQNVFFTLLIALLTIWGISKIRDIAALNSDLSTVLTLLIILAGCVAAYFLKTDYSYHGVLSVAVIYLLHENRILTCLGGALTFTWEPWAVPAFIPIFFYNGKRGLKAKYIFYLFYPLHIYFIFFIMRYVYHHL